MKRDIENILVDWKDERNRKPLLLRGARQVGKSYTVTEFGRKLFDNLITINFEQFPQYKECFNTLSPNEITGNISLLCKKDIIQGKTLLFLDEIQDCPEAITSLRYFYEQMPELHVIGAGSLLDFILTSENFKVPVGRIQYIYMRPLSFVEFLDAIGESKTRNFIEMKLITSVPNKAVHNHFMDLIKKYMILGGMPAVLEEYVSTGNLNKCIQIQSSIIQTYNDDFGKYSNLVKHKYLQKVFYAVPKMIGKKFKYSHVDANIKSRDLKEAVELLERAGIVIKVKKTSGEGLPLEANADEKHFKLVFMDTGLMQNICDLSEETLLTKDIMKVNSGAIAEQFVAQELHGYQNSFNAGSLFFWAREARNSSAEVDYLTPVKSSVVPVEVKAGKTGTLRSMHLYLEKYKTVTGIKISQSPLDISSQIKSIPLYGISLLSNNNSKDKLFGNYPRIKKQLYKM